MKRFLLIFLVFGYSLNLAAQDHELDSLLNRLKTAGKDTTQVQLLLSIAKKYSLNDPDRTLEFARKAKELSSSLNYPVGIAQAFKQVGIVYYKKSDWAEAI